MKKLLLLLALLMPVLVFSVTQRAEAVPSFARQIKAPCSACHTVWPNLNQYGRQFKVNAYTDASPDWNVIKNDRLNLFYVFPVSARIIFEPYQLEQDGSAPNPNPVNNSYNVNTTQIDNMQIFFASRIYKYAGVFTSVESGSIPGGSFSVAVSKVAFAYPFSNGDTIGAVLFYGLPTAADPFNSFGGWDRDIASPDTEGLPWVLNKGWTYNFWDGNNLGGVIHGYFLDNRLYAAIGATRGGNVEDADGVAASFMHSLPATPFGTAEGATGNPFGLYGRLAWDQSLPHGSVTFGGAVYTGRENVSDTGVTTFIGSTHVNRQYIDASLEQDLGDAGQHLVEAKGIFGFGQETGLAPLGTFEGNLPGTLGAGDKRSFNGGAVEADYFYNRTYGVVGQYNWVNNFHVDPNDFDPARTQHTWLVGLNYLPWYNTKVQFIYADVKSNYLTGGTIPVAQGASETDKIFKVLVDVVF
ncbi:MAG: hypothetical protein M0Z52_07935 [Actinomycetota bacterium]|nr:hypothetical protein [Actinomycetota bacterium]